MALAQSVHIANLEELRKNKTVTSLYITNGFQIHGVVEDYDEEVIIIRTDNKRQMVFRHAISTITLPDKKP